MSDSKTTFATNDAAQRGDELCLNCKRTWTLHEGAKLLCPFGTSGVKYGSVFESSGRVTAPAKIEHHHHSAPAFIPPCTRPHRDDYHFRFGLSPNTRPIG